MERHEDLLARVERLEAEARHWEARYHAQARPSRPRWSARRLFAAVMLVGLVVSGVAYAQLTTFNAGEPALASEINANFAQLRTWIEQKVGTVGTSTITLANGASVNNAGVVQGYSGLTLRGQAGNGNDLVVASDGTVSAGTSLSVAGRQVGLQGISYTRWGHSSCPGGRTTLYSGYMGGGFYNHTGGAASYLCMHPTPELIDNAAGFQDGAVIYKVEIETSLGAAPGLNGTGIHDDDARCAVCEAPRDQLLMVPGRLTCPSGWTEEYDGYLMTERYSHERNADVLCVDRSPTTGLNTGNENGGLLYPVEAGTPTIQGYTSGNNVSCVVCTR